MFVCVAERNLDFVSNNVAMFKENHTYSRHAMLITHKCQNEAATTVLTNRLLYSGRISWENTCAEYCRYVDCDLQNILYEHCVLAICLYIG